jgi:single-strand DNA-binding protein
MFETPLTVVGNIVNDLQRRQVGDQDVLRFRVASNSRRRAADGTWEPGNSLFISVTCWGRLVSAVGGALGKGSPVIVVGYVYTSDYEDRDGIRRSSLEMRATAVGADLARINGGNGKPAHSGAEAGNGQQGPEPAAQADTEGQTQPETAPEPSPEPQLEPLAGSQTELPAEPHAEPQPEPMANEDAGGRRDPAPRRKGLRVSA